MIIIAVIMIAKAIYVCGIVLTVLAAIDIWKMNVDSIKKLVVTVLLVLTNWIGIAFYYLYAKDRLEDWLSK